MGGESFLSPNKAWHIFRKAANFRPGLKMLNKSHHHHYYSQTSSQVGIRQVESDIKSVERHTVICFNWKWCFCSCSPLLLGQVWLYCTIYYSLRAGRPARGIKNGTWVAGGPFFFWVGLGGSGEKNVLDLACKGCSKYRRRQKKWDGWFMAYKMLQEKTHKFMKTVILQ